MSVVLRTAGRLRVRLIEAQPCGRSGPLHAPSSVTRCRSCGCAAGDGEARRTRTVPVAQERSFVLPGARRAAEEPHCQSGWQRSFLAVAPAGSAGIRSRARVAAPCVTPHRQRPGIGPRSSLRPRISCARPTSGTTRSSGGPTRSVCHEGGSRRASGAAAPCSPAARRARLDRILRERRPVQRSAGHPSGPPRLTGFCAPRYSPAP